MATATLPTTVVPGSGAKKFTGTCNIVIAQGQIVYKDTASRQYKLAQADVLATSYISGVALNTTGAGDGPVEIQNDGILDGCSGVTAGQVYVLSSTVAGDIMLESDITTGNFASIFGTGISTTQIKLAISNTGVAHA